MGQEVRIFVSYSHKDEALRDQVVTHLGLLLRQGFVAVWHDRKIPPGDRWAKKIDEQLKASQIILLLVSADFISSDFCYGKELDEAMKMDQEGKARVIPIILRPVDWKDAPFGELLVLPKDGKPITTWSNQDEAFVDVARGIREIVKAFLPNP